MGSTSAGVINHSDLAQTSRGCGSNKQLFFSWLCLPQLLDYVSCRCSDNGVHCLGNLQPPPALLLTCKQATANPSG